MKGYKHMTAAQRTEAIRLHRIPTPTPVIAARLGVSIRQVQHAIRKAGMELTRAKAGAVHANEDRLRAWAAEGLSLSEMARRIGTHKRQVKAFLARHGIAHTPFRQGGTNNPSWKGGRQIDKSGYVLIHRPDHPEANRHGYVREHRLVMEGKLGRPLLRTEVVHHKDGDRSNNHPDNLELFASNGEHLAATRAGRTPNWSEAGRLAVLEACRRGRESPKRSIRPA